MKIKKTIIVISLFLLSVANVHAANVDFNAIYNNHLDSCNNNQTSKDCKSDNASNHQCDSTKNIDEVGEADTTSIKPCVNAKVDNNVEPKFSTKRPRGQ